MERVQKIDMHAHMLYEKGVPRFGGDTFVIPEELLIFYRLLGIEKGVILPIVSPEGAYDSLDNKQSYRIVRKYPQYFYWFCNLDPRMGKNSPETDFSHFLNYYKERGAKASARSRPICISTTRWC